MAARGREGTNSSPKGAPAAVQAVARTLRAIELIVDSPNGISVAQLARELDSDNSVASRILSSLVADGYVHREAETERFQLSLKLVGLAFRYVDRLGFPSICMPILSKLSEQTGELAQLAVVERDSLLYVATSPGRQRLTIAPTIGREVSLHATATGKAWLATLSDEEALRLCLSQGLEPITANTLTTAQELLAEVARVREQGYSVSAGEFNEDISAVAVAIGVERFGRAVGALVVSCPSTRFEDRLEELVGQVEAAAAEAEASWPIDALKLMQPPG